MVALQVTGTWMTKLEALLRRLLLLRSAEPGCKALVFSQFPDALALASKAMDVAQVKHVSLGLGGGRDNKRTVREAIRKFSEDPEVCVFLLSLRAGAAGLTLTAASRVYLLEPGLDPAIEQQAVARVHRIGQEREVVITRLLVQGSVEEQVLGISEAKQALLAEAAQQHQQQQHQHHHSQQQQQQGEGPAAAAAADGSLGGAALLDAEDGEEVGSELEAEDEREDADMAMAGDAKASGDAWVTPVSPSGTPRTQQQQQQQHQRRRRSSSGAGAAFVAGAAAAAAPTTLQSVAPKKEAVGKEEVVGLLAAVMKQRGGRS